MDAEMVMRLQVIQGIRALLGCVPENEVAVEAHPVVETMRDLRTLPVRSAELANDHGVAPTFPIGELGEVAAAFQRGEHDAWRGRVLETPIWFDHGLDPRGEAYRAQIIRHWREITGRDDYDAAVNEDTPEIGTVEGIRRPGFYGSGDSHFVGGQLMAIGHILVRSGIRFGDRVLEYGAGIGQTALTFARMGAIVDTVDINAACSDVINRLGAHYEVDLSGQVGRFGANPAGADHAYDLVYIYEAFHHALDFMDLIPKLRSLLKPGGKVILAGEPVFDGPCAEMPYPWGFRLDWENVAVMRIRGWMELGFQKQFLLERFSEAGFECTEHRDPNSHWAQVLEFRQID
jgi:2-polyprenyl-3-methyl-5-hydroxy-6-metoxy-1,4-benzoquinol methylase